MTPEMRDALSGVGTSVVFEDGDVLRQKGAFAPDLLLITEGQVDCFLSDDGAASFAMGPDTIVGEIGFLTGQAATATLRAFGPVAAKSVDASALRRLQQQTPTIAADVLRHLAQLLQQRSQENVVSQTGAPQGTKQTVEIIRCFSLDQKRSAQRLRYDVHCLEKGLGSADADEQEGLIRDALDRTSTSFLAIADGRPVGMMRVNFFDDLPSDHLSAETRGLAPEACVQITAVSIRETYMNDDMLEPLVGAIETFAKASGKGAVLVAIEADLAPDFERCGFTRTAQDLIHSETDARAPMIKVLSQDTPRS